jgi:hypothetical protein
LSRKKGLGFEEVFSWLAIYKNLTRSSWLEIDSDSIK